MYDVHIYVLILFWIQTASRMVGHSILTSSTFPRPLFAQLIYSFISLSFITVNVCYVQIKSY